MSLTLTILMWLAGCSWDRNEHDSHKQGGAHGEHDDHDDHAADVKLTPEAVTAARITVLPATEGTLDVGITIPARVTLDPRRESIVSAWISGQVDVIAVRPGDAVRRGQRLATVQSPELGEAVAAYRTAKAQDVAADARLERLKRLEADGVTSRAQLLQAEADHAEVAGALEAAEERLRVIGVSLDVGDPHAGEHFPSRVPVRSPIAGTVLTAHASAGQRVEPGQMLFQIGDLDEVWLLLDIYERDLSAVREGQAAKFTVEAWPKQTFEGTVAKVGDWIDPDARTIEVRVVVANADHKLKPNMFAQASLAVEDRAPDSGVVLPANAVVRLDSADAVFVEEEPGHFRVQPVVVAERTSAEVRLANGISVGQRIVTDGAFALKSELEKGELGEGHAH